MSSSPPSTFDSSPGPRARQDQDYYRDLIDEREGDEKPCSLLIAAFDAASNARVGVILGGAV